MPEVVHDAERKSLGVGPASQEYLPKLVLVVSANPEMPEYPVFRSQARSNEGPGVMRIVRESRDAEVFAGQTRHEFPVRVELAIVLPSVDDSATRGILAKIVRLVPAIPTDVAGLHFQSESTRRPRHKAASHSRWPRERPVKEREKLRT